ncbi:MAG TPA: hypothetical protein VFQ53_08975 [Kofleriaceae bacterium]|nr:hypothetical protein [Kofleriaceae bacterium]
MRIAASLVLVLGCSEPAPPTTLVDAAPDAGAIDDPFTGRFDDPADFPRTSCRAGALAGFAHAELYPALAMRTTVDGALATYVARSLDDVLVPHQLTADDLFVRHVELYPQHAELIAIDVCDVDADGTLRGAIARCLEDASSTFPCTASEFVASPLHRIAGESDGEHLSLVGELGGDWPRGSSNVRVVGDLAYLSRLEDGLRIVSIANAAAPVELGHLAVPNDFANDLAIVSSSDGRRYAVVASTFANIIDVTDPRDPQLVAQLPFNPHTVFVEGTTAYFVTGGNAVVSIWDLSAPRTPKRLAQWTAPDSPTGIPPAWHDVYVTGGIAYLSDMFGVGMVVVDFRDPTQPIVLGGETGASDHLWHTPWLTTVGGKRLALDGDESTVTGFRILDGDPASPTLLATRGEWKLRDEVPAHDLMAIGARVYLAHYRDGVRVVDISNPASPQQIAYYNTWIEGTGTASGFEAAFGIDLDPARKRIYVADATRGLLILQGDTTVFP